MQTSSIITAVSAIIRVDGRYLLARRLGANRASDSFAFPGGKVEQGENLMQALTREVLEETSLILKTAIPYLCYDIKVEAELVSKNYKLHTFFVDVFNADNARAGDDAAELLWKTINEALLLPMHDTMHACFNTLSERNTK